MELKIDANGSDYLYPKICAIYRTIYYDYVNYMFANVLMTRLNAFEFLTGTETATCAQCYLTFFTYCLSFEEEEEKKQQQLFDSMDVK